MAKDYAKKSKSKKTASRGSGSKKKQPQKDSSLIWIILSIAIVLIIALLYFLQTQGVLQKIPLHPYHRHHKIHHLQKKIRTSQKEKFDFYTILPKMKVRVPREQQGFAKNSTGIKYIYVVQAASFKNYADADRLKASLILQGYGATIKPIKKYNRRWSRVWIGPFNTEDEAFKTKRALYQQGIKGVILKVDG